jgi:hypothetical protein
VREDAAKFYLVRARIEVLADFSDLEKVPSFLKDLA